MRWILVFLLLYIIPVGLLFKNNDSLKRSSMHASMYTVAITLIVICNIYGSTVNKLESIINNNNYISSKKDKKEDIEVKQSEKNNQDMSKDIVENNEEVDEIETEAHIINIENNHNTEKSCNEVIKTDYEIIKEFKKEIYEIERIALIPMRECIPDMKNIEITPSAIINAKEDIIFAKNKCDEVVNIYEDMEVPKLSKVEYMDKLEQSKTNVKNAYILRGKAMDSAEKLLNTKNLKYITEIKEYLSLSDEQIKEFVDTTKELQNKVKNIE